MDARIPALILAAVMLATPGAHADGPVRDTLEVPTRDGDTIRVEILRDPALDPQPVLLTLSPYNQTPDPTGAQPQVDQFSGRYVPRGIARAWGDVLGTRGSSGCWNYGGETEARSAVDLVNALAALPWSNGRVGMIGISYDGTTPLQVATRGADAPGLAAVVAMAGVASWYDYDYSRGARNKSGSGVSALFDTEYSRPPPPLLPPNTNQNPDALAASTRPCEIDDHTLRSYTDTPRYDAWWAERNSTVRAPNVRVPTVLVHGWTDENVQTGQSIGFYNALPDTVERFVYAHPGAHQYPTGERWFGFLDRFLYESLQSTTPNYADIPRVWSTASGLAADATWDAFPPATSVATTYGLAQGTLASSADPAAPASFTGLASGVPGTTTALTYDTAPFAAHTRMTGTPTADLWLSLDSAREQIAAELFEVVGSSRRRITTSYLDLRYIDGLEQPVDRTPGAPFLVHLTFQPRDYYIRAGARLRLRISGYDGGQLYPPRGSVVTVHHGDDGMTSTLSVPYITP